MRHDEGARRNGRSSSIKGMGEGMLAPDVEVEAIAAV
jgi:hypothetical protein